MTALDWIGVAVAGAVGAPLRYLVDGLAQERSARHFPNSPFPFGTFVVNLTGSFLLGLITGFALYHGFRGTPRLVLGAGFCGAYTTFSTAAFEVARLGEEEGTGAGVGYALVSTVAGGLAAASGLALAALG